MADEAAAALAALTVAPTVEAKKPYYEKRVALFQKYKAREAEAIEKVQP